MILHPFQQYQDDTRVIMKDGVQWNQRFPAKVGTLNP